MTGFVDIHTHVLPGVDDGAKDFAQGLALLRQAYDNGTRTMVFTPHYRGKYRANTPEMLKERFEEFCGAAALELPEMKLYLGQEVYYDTGTPEALAEGRALPLNDTGYAMLEFSPKSTPEDIQKGIDAFLYYGYHPVIAHVERYTHFRRAEVLVEYALARGALLQLNADSVLGKNGLAVKQFCHKLLKSGRVSFIASDAHDTAKRPPLLRECFLYVHKKYGKEYALRLFYENPVAMLENQEF